MLNKALSILYCLFTGTFAFNFFPQYAEIFTNNNPKSYFGYSVILQASPIGQPAQIIVGAPRANSSFYNDYITEPGAVYVCPFNGESCKQFVFSKNGNIVINQPNGVDYRHKKEYSWLGAAMDGEDFVGGLLVVCAPRWINQYFKDEYYQNGMCYFNKDTKDIQKEAEELMPLVFADKQVFLTDTEKSSYYYYGLGEVGMSVHLTQNYTDILLGAPGILSWKGMIVKYSTLDISITPEIPNPYFINKIADDSYFGYTSSSGKFNKQSNKIWYVGGAPRGKNLNGQVLVYEYRHGINDLKIHFEFNGRQQGEYFGAALTVGDLNNDDVDDIIVGSPMYSIEECEEKRAGRCVEIGCIYVYINNGKGIFTKIIINGPKQPFARFGSAISVIGDINKDNFADVAIGAPYYNDRQGAIFIYLGSESGISDKYSQMILASEVDNSLRGFGISFSRGVDIDHNHYNDLAVGAYLSGHVVVLKSRPVVTIIPSLLSVSEQISIDTRSFNITACLKYEGMQVPPMLNVKIKITVDKFYKRAYFSKNSAFAWEVTKQYPFGEVVCEDLEISVQKQQSDFTQPIIIEMIHELLEETNNGKFCSTCPVVDIRTPKSINLNIPFQIGCGSDKICQPALELKAQFNYDKPSLVIGTVDELAVSVQIKNTGEPAYFSKFFAEIPLSATLDEIPNICEENYNIVSCDIGNPFNAHEEISFTLYLNVSSLSNKDLLTINMNVTSTGSETNLKDNLLSLNLTLESKADISVMGISEPSQIFLRENKWPESDFLQFSHRFLIENIGPSPVDDLELYFMLPNKLGLSNENIIDILKSDLTATGNFLNCVIYNKGSIFVDTKENKVIESKGIKSTQIQDKSKRSVVQLEFNDSIALLRSNTQQIKSSDFEDHIHHSDRTLHINCNLPELDVTCVQVKCTGGPLKKSQSGIMVNFPLKANLKYLNTIKDKKDTIIITSSVQLKSKYADVNITHVHTTFFIILTPQNILKWIIIAGVLGLLLVCAIMYGLYKYGFFKRVDIEKLQNDTAAITLMNFTEQHTNSEEQ